MIYRVSTTIEKSPRTGGYHLAFSKKKQISSQQQFHWMQCHALPQVFVLTRVLPRLRSVAVCIPDQIQHNTIQHLKTPCINKSMWIENLEKSGNKSIRESLPPGKAPSGPWVQFERSSSPQSTAPRNETSETAW